MVRKLRLKGGSNEQHEAKGNESENKGEGSDKGDDNDASGAENRKDWEGEFELMGNANL
jgi:hypothetical protein